MSAQHGSSHLLRRKLRLWAGKFVPETSRLAKGRAGKNTHVARWSPFCHCPLVPRKVEQWGRPGSVDIPQADSHRAALVPTVHQR